MAIYKVEICGINTAGLPLLSEEEKQELFRRIKEGDAQARDACIKGNLRLVLSIVQRFAGKGGSMDDLFQIGCVGLIKAVDNFDTGQNVKFSTYAVPMNIEKGKSPESPERREKHCIMIIRQGTVADRESMIGSIFRIGHTQGKS